MNIDEKFIRDLLAFNKQFNDINYEIVSVDDTSVQNVVIVKVKINNYYINELSFTFMEVMSFLYHSQNKMGDDCSFKEKANQYSKN